MPRESSVIRKIGYDRLMLVHLRDECRITSVLRVEMHEPLTNTYKLVIIQMRRPNEAEVWRALHIVPDMEKGHAPPVNKATSSIKKPSWRCKAAT